MNLKIVWWRSQTLKKGTRAGDQEWVLLAHLRHIWAIAAYAATVQIRQNSRSDFVIGFRDPIS